MSLRRARMLRGGAIPIIVWIVAALGTAAVGSYTAYKNGYDMGIFKAMANALSTWSMELILHLMHGGTMLLSSLPEMNILKDQSVNIIRVFEMGATVNLFLPVVELFLAFGFFMGFLVIFITVKLVLKLIPTIG